MPDVLTHQEYRTIAAELSLPVHAHIDGKFAAPRSGKTMDSINPATGAVLVKVAAREMGRIYGSVLPA